MKNRVGYINEKELKRAIKLMKENEATYESGMIAEYIKALRVGMALHAHNEMVMRKICEGGNKSGLYVHMKMLIGKGKTKNDSKKLIDNDGETIDDEIMLKAI